MGSIVVLGEMFRQYARYLYRHLQGTYIHRDASVYSFDGARSVEFVAPSEKMPREKMPFSHSDSAHAIEAFEAANAFSMLI